MSAKGTREERRKDDETRERTGPEMSDLSILPPFFFLLEEGAEAEDEAFFVLSVEYRTKPKIHLVSRCLRSSLSTALPPLFLQKKAL
jgi:hypothetical protein